MGRLRSAAPLLQHRIDSKVLKVKSKEVEPFYKSLDYQRWREIVIAKAGYRCEALIEGIGWRCTKAEPQHRMFADHVIELQDGGAPFDPANGRCLCGSHHSFKTAQARASRLRGGGVV
jgi:5-methylcytosine-specific restriction enzyme A